MPVENPCCCGCSLRTGTQIVAIFNIVLNSIGCFFLFVGVFGIGVIVFAGDNLRESDPVKYEEKFGNIEQRTVLTILLIITFITLLVVIFQLIASIVLLIGANQRDLKKCRFWFIVTVIFLILSGLRCTFETMTGGEVISYIFSLMIGFAITSYQLWVVHAFMEELKEGGSVDTVGYVHDPADPGQAYIYTKPADGPGNAPPPYSETQEGYVPVHLNNAQGPVHGYPSASGYTPAVIANPAKAPMYPPQPSNPRLDVEKGPNY